MGIMCEGVDLSTTQSISQLLAAHDPLSLHLTVPLCFNSGVGVSIYLSWYLYLSLNRGCVGVVHGWV